MGFILKGESFILNSNNKLNIFVHTDLVTEEILVVLKDFILSASSRLNFLFPAESKLLYKLADVLVELEFSVEVFFAFSKAKHLESVFVQKSLELLSNYDKATFHNFEPSFIAEKDAIKLRNLKILESCDQILFGELLTNGVGLSLATIAIEKNKKIICCPLSYFSFGYAGIEVLVNSGSATLLSPKDFEN